jgi:uncharacterized protein YndB with AHSA1/START domain
MMTPLETVMNDVKQQINAVGRTVGTRQLEAGQAQVSTISQVYDTDIEDLWDVVTSAERIPRWFLPISGDLAEGGHYQLEGNAGGTITNCDKPRSYAATWEYGGTTSWIEVRLSPEGDGRTRFELEHVGVVAEEFWNQFGPGATGIGWDMGLYGLAGYVESPEARVTPAEAAAWMASDDGKEFIRLSSEAWYDAHVAAGEDPLIARGMADRSSAAYTGG